MLFLTTAKLAGVCQTQQQLMYAKLIIWIHPQKWSIVQPYLLGQGRIQDFNKGGGGGPVGGGGHNTVFFFDRCQPRKSRKFFFGAPPASIVAQVPNGGGGGGGESDTSLCSDTFMFFLGFKRGGGTCTKKGGGNCRKAFKRGGGHGPGVPPLNPPLSLVYYHTLRWPPAPLSLRILSLRRHSIVGAGSASSSHSMVNLLPSSDCFIAGFMVKLGGLPRLPSFPGLR